jgi:hypothetical protein
MENSRRVLVHLYTQALPIVLDYVDNAYQKGDLYCVLAANTVYKFPLQHIFRITEEAE